MGTALAVATAVKGLGTVVAAGAAGCAVLLPEARTRAWSALLALVITPLLLVGSLWNSPQVEHLRNHGALAAAALVAALVVVCALALLLARRPRWLPLLVAAALRFRLPLESGGQSANLLAPLYLVIAAGVLAYAWQRLGPAARAHDGVRGNGAGEIGEWRDRHPGRVELALVVFVLLYALQSLYSTDFEQALKNVSFFYVPFLLMLKMLTSVPWSRWVVTRTFGVAVVLALVFAGVGFVEYATHHIFWNQKVIASNQFESYFRVNSLFFDPNIYGRFLAMTMLGLAALLLWPRRRSEVLIATGALAVLWAALVLTFSQSSFGALLLGLGVLAALRWGWRPVAVLTGAAAIIGIAVVIAAPGLIHLNLKSRHSVNRASSGRFGLVRGGVRIFGARPVWGFGSGSFAERYRTREKAGARDTASASHTIAITVAAEQGVVGLAAYIAILVTAFMLLFRGVAGLRGRAPPARMMSRAYVAAAFTGLVLHTLLYASFLEDPITWTLIAAGIVLAAGTRPTTAPADGNRARTETART